MIPNYPIRERAPDRRERVLGSPSPELVAKHLAESGCDLSRWDHCCDALIARGVRPSAVPDLEEAIAMARALRDEPPGMGEIVACVWLFATMTACIGVASLMGGGVA